VPIYYQIRQIIISPSGRFLAVCTEHTVHVVVLPDASRLKEQDRSPLKVKAHQLGPTVHVIPESPLAAVLWHPLANATTSTDCLVTVTAEAAVRVWEFEKSSSWSVDRPQLAIDLRKLADGVSSDQNFEPSGFGKNRGFSVDTFDMEVSSARFGGRAADDEDAWASMTLWVAMRNGDIYALCPLLPSKWKPTPTSIPSLTTTAISRLASLNNDDSGEEERRAAEQQYEWVQEIDNEEPQVQQSTDSLAKFEVRSRPRNPGAIPRLQGPFSLFSEDDDIEIEISDLFVFPALLDEDDLFDGEDDYPHRAPGDVPIAFTTICVATSDNEVFIAIDLDGVSGQWLPQKGRRAFVVPSSDVRQLTMIDSMRLGDTKQQVHPSWPVFTLDTVTPYSVFVNTSKAVYSVSTKDWTSQLGTELSGTEPVDNGLRVRLETRCQNEISTFATAIECTDASDVLSAPTIVDDESIGYMLLAPSVDRVYAVMFDRHYFDASTLPSNTDFNTSSRLNSQLITLTDSDVSGVPARETFAPSRFLYENQLVALDSLRKRLPLPLKKAVIEKPMRLSPAMLEVMTATHRTMSIQSGHLETAAHELWPRIERLRDEMLSQIKQMAELAEQLQRLSATEEQDEYGKIHPIKRPEQRLQDAQEKQKQLVTRYEALRRKVGRLSSGKKDLSSKELAWFEEVDGMEKVINSPNEVEQDQESVDRGADVGRRYGAVSFLSI
jgi:nucleoporin NUP82